MVLFGLAFVCQPNLRSKCGFYPFSDSFRRVILGNQASGITSSRKPIYSFANRYPLGPGQLGSFAPRWARWGTQHIARPHTYAVGEDPVTIAQQAKPL